MATAWPASTVVADFDLEGDHTRERRGDLAGLGRVGLLGGLASATLDAAVADEHGAELAVEGGHTVRMPLSSASPMASRPTEAHALVDLDHVLAPWRRP